jgi:hypothetical protein
VTTELKAPLNLFMEKLLLVLATQPILQMTNVVISLKTIEILVEKFIISHHKSITYYPQRNGQAELTNKTLGKILTKLANAN